MKFRVWHIPQVPGKPYRIDVESKEEGQKILHILAIYDQFQFQNQIKPDYCNMNGIEYFDEVENDWMDIENLSEYPDDEVPESNDFLKKLREDNDIDEFY